MSCSCCCNVDWERFCLQENAAGRRTLRVSFENVGIGRLRTHVLLGIATTAIGAAGSEIRIWETERIEKKNTREDEGHDDESPLADELFRFEDVFALYMFTEAKIKKLQIHIGSDGFVLMA